MATIREKTVVNKLTMPASKADFAHDYDGSGEGNELGALNGARSAQGVPEIEIVHINDLTSPEQLAHLLTHDSVHGGWNVPVTVVAVPDAGGVPLVAV